MYCEWCGHHYQRQDKTHKNKCIPCAERYNLYYARRHLYKKNPTEYNREQFLKVQREYEELAIQGFRVPKSITTIRR